MESSIEPEVDPFSDEWWLASLNPWAKATVVEFLGGHRPDLDTLAGQLHASARTIQPVNRSLCDLYDKVLAGVENPNRRTLSTALREVGPKSSIGIDFLFICIRRFTNLVEEVYNCLPSEVDDALELAEDKARGKIEDDEYYSRLEGMGDALDTYKGVYGRPPVRMDDPQLAPSGYWRHENGPIYVRTPAGESAIHICDWASPDDSETPKMAADGIILLLKEVLQMYNGWRSPKLDKNTHVWLNRREVLWQQLALLRAIAVSPSEEGS